MTSQSKSPDLIAALEYHKEEAISALAATLEVCRRAFDRLATSPDPTIKATYARYCQLVDAGTNPDGTIRLGAPAVPQALEDEVYELQCAERVAIAESIYHHFIGYLPPEPPTLPEPPPAATCPHALMAMPLDPEELAAIVAPYADDPKQFVQNLLSLTEGTRSPTTVPVWASAYDPESVPEHLYDDGCAIIYDKDGSIFQIGPHGCCACFSNDVLGICLESIPAIIAAITRS